MYLDFKIPVLIIILCCFERYQKKIATYDKEPWEKTVEEKILYAGFGGGVRLKNAKLKTDLIDVDLVRGEWEWETLSHSKRITNPITRNCYHLVSGSTFPKAKPKQSLLTVLRLALLRVLFLPLYARWWVRQTSSSVFLLLFLLYITQMVNWAIYVLHINAREIHAMHSLNQTGGDFEEKFRFIHYRNTLSTPAPAAEATEVEEIILKP